MIKYLQGYFKFIFPKTMVFGLQFWFAIHRSVMYLVCIISVIGLGIIFTHKEWKWTDPFLKFNFAHSIFGILTVGLALIQVTK